MTEPEQTDSTEPDTELLEQIRAIHEVVGHYFSMTLEEFEIGFLRADDPDSQVAMWSEVTAAWIAYHEEYLNDEVLPKAEEKRLVAALIAISAGVEDVSKLGVSIEVGSRLLECFDGLEEE